MAPKIELKSIKIDNKSMKIDKLGGNIAKMKPKRPKRSTKIGKRGNKGAISTLDLTIDGDWGPWPGGRRVQLNDHKPKI